jgi:hypothetical protein
VRLPSDARLHAIATHTLARQARAVRRDDEKAFLADVSRSAPDFLASQRRLFENLQGLPLQRFTLRPERWGTWPSGFAADRWAATAYIPRVVRTMRLRGFDTGPMRVVYGETFARDHGRWQIVSDQDTAAQSRTSRSPRLGTSPRSGCAVSRTCWASSTRGRWLRRLGSCDGPKTR